MWRFFLKFIHHTTTKRVVRTTFYTGSAATTVLWLYLGIRDLQGSNSATLELAKILQERNMELREARAQEYLDRERLSRIQVSDEDRQHFLRKYPHWKEEQVRLATFYKLKSSLAINEQLAGENTSQGKDVQVCQEETSSFT